MYYFYVLQFENNKKLYKGFTNDLKRRLIEHKLGKTRYTSLQGNFNLIFYEAYLNKRDARNAERYFKTGHGREVLREKLKHHFGGVA